MTDQPQYRVCVTGGRDYQDADFVSYILDQLVSIHGDIVLIEGGATGADYHAREWYRAKYGKDPITVEAEWTKFGKAAGGIRNQRMLDEFKPDLVVIFPGNSGTMDMYKRSRKAKAAGQLAIYATSPLRRM